MIHRSAILDLAEQDVVWSVPTGRDQRVVFDSRLTEAAWTSAVVDVVYRLGPEYEWRNVNPRVTLSAAKQYVDTPVSAVCFPEIGLQVTTKSASSKPVEFVCVTSNLAYDVGR